MKSSLTIQSWLDGFSSPQGVAVCFDVFRCSTTIHCLAQRNEGPLFTSPSLQIVRDHPRVRGMRVFSELSQPVECAERFDNSPLQALTKDWKNKVEALVATTTGTPSMFAARKFKRVYVGSLVNFSSLVSHLSQLNEPITLIPAAIPEWQHVEDEITAFAMATAIEGFSNIPDFVRGCAESAKEKILASPRVPNLSKKLSTGAEDTSIALEIDKYSQILALEFDEGNDPLFARVISL